jgi:hypothetical protein
VAPGLTSGEAANPQVGPYRLVPEMSALCSSFVHVAFTLSGLLAGTLLLLHEDKESGTALVFIQLWEGKDYFLFRPQPLRLPEVFPSCGGLLLVQGATPEFDLGIVLRSIWYSVNGLGVVLSGVPSRS